MKTTVTLLILLTVVSLNTFAQEYTQQGLPDGAKMRLGKGRISELAYSPDGTWLAVASSIGIWALRPCNRSRGRPPHGAFGLGLYRRVQS